MLLHAVRTTLATSTSTTPPTPTVSTAVASIASDVPSAVAANPLDVLHARRGDCARWVDRCRVQSVACECLP